MCNLQRWWFGEVTGCWEALHPSKCWAAYSRCFQFWQAWHTCSNAFRRSKKRMPIQHTLNCRCACSIPGKASKAGYCSVTFLNPLSAIWRIYPSSKWSSLWPYDGFIRHGWMTSCGHGRDSATPECFRRDSQGMIFVQSSKYLFSFKSYVHFEEFVSRAFVRFKLAPNARALGLLVRRCHGALFENSASSPGIFCELWIRPRVFFENFLSFFKAEPVSLAWQLWWSPGWAKYYQNENLTFGSWRDRGLNSSKDRRSSSRSVRVACGDPWSKGEKTQWSQSVIERSINPSSFTKPTSLGACFGHPPMSLPFCTSLFPCTLMHSCRSVR